MEARTYISVCIIAVCVLHSVSANVQFSITPTTFDLDGQNPTGGLIFTCQPGSDFTDRFQTTIVRSRNNQPEDVMLQLKNTDNGNPSAQGVFQQRITSITGDGTSLRVSFNLTRLTCDDASYTYMCNVLGNTPSNPSAPRAAAMNITARTNPGVITMSRSPQRTEYDEGQSVTFSCYGDIGNNFNENQLNNLWQWDYRNVADPAFPGSWLPYTANITTQTPTTAGNCQYNGRSSLSLTVRLTDHMKEFRCRVQGSTVDRGYANFTVAITGQTTTRPPGTGPATAGPDNTGMIVGIVVGVLVLIVIVVVLVYFLVFRKRQSGDDYDTGEGKGDRPEMTDNVVYTTPASKQPHRGVGRENDALDEPHEKNPRSYYANDYGRSNPAMEDDHMKHNSSYDDDNTDTRQPRYGSAV